MSLLSHRSGNRPAASGSSRGGPSSNLLQEALDFDTSALIAQLALDDLEDSRATTEEKGKARFDAALTDAEIAMRLQAEEFEQFPSFAEDSKYAQQLDKLDHSAVPTIDEQAQLEAFLIMERAAEDDRRAAEMLARGQPLPPLTENQRRMEQPAFRVQLGLDSDLDLPLNIPALKPRSELDYICLLRGTHHFIS